MFERRHKKNFCMTTHLTEEEALHVAVQAYERSWSNSSYIGHLIREDIKRHFAESHLMEEVARDSSKRFDFFEPFERDKKT